MRMLIALIILFLCCFKCNLVSGFNKTQQYLIFSNDGTFYKLDPGQQYVDWHSDLGSKLIYFQLEETEANFQNEVSKYFIPTIEGHFVYIDRNKQILVHRQQIEPLLNMCFGKSSQNKQIAQNDQQQYFLHQKYQYFFIDLNNGKLWNIEKFFEDKIVVKQQRHALIKISKKFLKQLSFDFKVKWSAISSKIDIISAFEFLKDPQKSFVSQQIQQKKHEFRRISNHQLQVENLQNQMSFRMGGSSPVMAIFYYDKFLNKFYNYPIKYYQKPMLALGSQQDKMSQNRKIKLQKTQLQIFPHASEYKNSNNLNSKFRKNYEKHQFDFQYCLNTFRAIQQLSGQENIDSTIPFIRHMPHKQINDNMSSGYNKWALPPSQQYSPTSHPHLFVQPERSKDQPLIWIFIIGSLIIIGVIIYRFKVNKLLNELQKMETINDQKFSQIQKKLGQFQQMQKMYQVFWDKLLYQKARRKSSDQFIQVQEVLNQNQKVKSNHQIQIYQHLVFEGRFLNKQALVYAVPLESIDLIHVQHQLNDLLSCSHKSLIKLYYYTKNSQFLLIFCQKIQPLWNSIENSGFFKPIKKKYVQKNIKQIENNKSQILSTESTSPKSQQKTRWKFKNVTSNFIQIPKLQNLIKEIIDCVSYLDSRLQIFSLPLECIILNQKISSNYEKSTRNQFDNNQLQLKLNTIPSILQVYKYDIDSEEDNFKALKNMNRKLRHDLVNVFYFIINQGQKVNFKDIHSINSQETNEEQFFVKDFYDFIINQNYNLNIQIQTQDQQKKESNFRKLGAHYQFLNHLQCHPYLWDSKRKMLFLSDFSNYIQTYLDDNKVKKLQSYARDYHIIDTPWTKHLDPSFVKQVNTFRKYDFNSIKDLIRLIRNKINHFHEIPKQTRLSIGKTPQEFIEYMLKLYPKILSFAFVYAKRKKWKLHVKIK